MKEQIYDIAFLREYLKKKKEGFTDPHIEQRIEEDSFLRDLVIGLEQSIRENHTPEQFLDSKKKKIWQTIQSQSLPFFTTQEKPQNIFQKIRSLKLDLPDLELYYLVSFNCVCFLLVLTAGLWISLTQDSVELLSAIEVVEGFKP